MTVAMALPCQSSADVSETVAMAVPRQSCAGVSEAQNVYYHRFLGKVRLHCFQSKEDVHSSNRLWTLLRSQILFFFSFFLVVTTDTQFRAICRCSINSKYVLQISIHLWRVKGFFAVRQFIPSIQYLPDVILRTMYIFREHCLVIKQSIWRWTFGDGFLLVE